MFAFEIDNSEFKSICAVHREGFFYYPSHVLFELTFEC